MRSQANWTCDKCGYQHKWWRPRRSIHAHHLADKSSNPSKAYTVSNGVCLCSICHIDRFHIEWKGGTQVPCTAADYYAFKRADSGWFKVVVGAVVLYLLVVTIL